MVVVFYLIPLSSIIPFSSLSLLSSCTSWHLHHHFYQRCHTCLSDFYQFTHFFNSLTKNCMPTSFANIAISLIPAFLASTSHMGKRLITSTGYIPISINFLTNTCKVISFHLQKPLGNNQDLIRKQMLFGIVFHLLVYL